MSTENLPSRTSSIQRMLNRTGRYFILVVVALLQLLMFPGLLIGAAIIQVNANIKIEYFSSIVSVSVGAILVSYIVLLIYSHTLTRQASARLGEWAEMGNLTRDAKAEREAWKQITSFPWKYGLFFGFVIIVFQILPVIAYQFFTMHITSDQVIYSFFGGLVPGISVIVITTLALERMLVPAQEILLPRSFEEQLVGTVNFRMLLKILLIGTALIGITVLLIAPIGYHQTYKAVYETIGSSQLFEDMRFQLIAASILVIIVGLGITFTLSRSMTIPVRNLIETFNKVEQGDLSQRARVLGTDEVGSLAIYFNRMLSQLEDLQQTLEKRIESRTQQLRASVEVGQIASTILDPDEVITKVVNLITKTFDYYYAAIFFVSDNGRWAELKDATGTAGEILKSRRHRLQVGGTSMVGKAISTKSAQIALDTGEAPVRFNNPLLPNTRSEIAMPLVVGDRIIGALDVQSMREADFKSEDIAMLEGMADQVAIAIENARLFKEMDQTLEELRQANRQYIVSAWSDKVKGGTLEFTAKAPVANNEPSKEVEVGLNLRGQNIGQIRMEMEGEWAQEDQEWVETLATQVAISLENARLLEESQQSALRERLSASIVQRIWSANSIDTILQTAIREMGRAMEASEASIELNVED